MTRIALPGTWALLTFAVVVATAHGEAIVAEATAIEKLELLGGKIERDEAQPGQPVTAIGFGPNSRFGDKHFYLLKSFPQLQSLDLRFAHVGDAGLDQLRELAELKSLFLDPVEISFDVWFEFKRSSPHLRIVQEDSERAALRELQKRSDRFLMQTKTDDRKICYLRFEGKFCDEDLPFLNQIHRLEELQLNKTQITDAGLHQLGNLKGLTLLHLSDTNITDDGLKGIRGLQKLRDLRLCRTKISDAGIESLATLKELRRLELDGTAVTDAGLKRLGGMPQLEVLDLRGTQITDQGLGHLARLTHLKLLVVRQTATTDAGIQELNKLLPKTIVHP